jgi:hypothetical protein|tara:strand:+ start:1204 stop:1461 length:258 start_codon:yes stop_codon:yes gene_type:complete
MKTSQELIKLYIKKTYPGHYSYMDKEGTLDRYAELLAFRSAKFYIQGNMDLETMDEDLLHEEGRYVNLDSTEDDHKRYYSGLNKM